MQFLFKTTNYTNYTNFLAALRVIIYNNSAAMRRASASVWTYIS